MSIKEKLISTYKEYCKDSSWINPTEEPSDGELIDFLSELDTVYEKKVSSSRWWNNIEKVSEFEGTYFSYMWAETTGDMGIWEAGWEFDWSSLREVEPYTDTVIVTKYRYK